MLLDATIVFRVTQTHCRPFLRSTVTTTVAARVVEIVTVTERLAPLFVTLGATRAT